MNARSFSAGFASLEVERPLTRLPVTGALPAWLDGTLLRNGPAKFEAGADRLRHWFDGYAMIHSFAFRDGAVTYRNAFLDTKAYRYAKAVGTIGYSEFATDPCRSMFGRFAQVFSPVFTDNANVNFTRLADELVALTETPLPVRFDPRTLAAAGVVHYADALPTSLTTAHPHEDPGARASFNYMTQFGRNSTCTVCRIAHGTRERIALATIDTPEPSYMHSFGLTERFVVLTEFPFVVNPLTLLLSGKPFIENFVWQPERGTRVWLIERATGAVRGPLVTAPFFAFHHINAFDADGRVVFDIAAYEDAAIIRSFYLDVLRGETPHPPLPLAEFRRYRVDVDGGGIDHEVITDAAVELPRINYARANMKDYRYVYATGPDLARPDPFLDRLVKVDIAARAIRTWSQPHCHPGEPVFVPRPGGADEDDGIILSVVLDAGAGTSYLVVLDAASFAEIARATVPHVVPFGFHGQFLA